MVEVKYVYFTSQSNHSGILERTAPAKYVKTAKVLSDVIIQRIENTGCKYKDICILKLKLPNDKEQDITASMFSPANLENVLEEVIRTLPPEDETPSLQLSMEWYKEHRGVRVPKNVSRPVKPATKYKSCTESYDNSSKILCNDTETLKPNYVGLVNQAMTCYLNSLLQALYMTPEFRNALYNWEYKSSEKNTTNSSTTSNSIPYQLQKLFLNLQTSQKTAVETTSLTKSFGWNSNDAWHQHDIQELCRVMFDALELTFTNTAQADLINRLYEGKINDYVKCLTCNTEKFREDTFLDIPLPVRPFDTNVAYGSVEEALEAFVKYETLEGNNQYFCEKCDKKSNAHKGLKFTKFPYILTLQLKRFDFDQNTYHRIKLNDKVTFPDVLNLNTFIESSSNKESPLNEEDAGMSVKCDDSITTDSSTMDETEYASSDIILSNSNHLSNPDQDDDEGIDVSNGMSSSSSSMHNNNAEKIREDYAEAKGPYIYELFSIMIHSGSASGGHYYAYIKDFRTDKWLCFNDQIVTPITQDEIQKTYGGGNRPGYFSGAYRSSTNAYMLMYRQIDPKRNALPMQADDFPPHIKELLEKMKKSEEERNCYIDEPSFVDRRYNRPIYYRHPATGEVKEVFVSFRMSMTLRQIAEATYKEANLDSLVDFEQCRIVNYLPRYDLIECSYEDCDHTKLEDLFDYTRMNLLLDIRPKSEQFESYLPMPIITKVYVIDALDTNIVDGPKYIRANQKQTIQEFKQELKKHFNLDPNTVQLLCQEIQQNKLLDDDLVLESKYSGHLFKIGATDSYEHEMLMNLEESVFFKMCEYLDDIVTFYVDTSKVTKEQLVKQGIPTLDEYYKEEKTQENTNSLFNCVTDEISKFNISSSYNNSAKNHSQIAPNSDMTDVYEMILQNKGAIDKEECKVQETSNSEDSSLSDSDRTLVGDVPEESELDCESALNPADRFTGSHFYPNSLINQNNESELVKYFKISTVKNQKLLKISVDYRIKEDELKEKLESSLNIPKDYFKLTEFVAEDACSYSSSRNKLVLKEDQKYSICLGRICNSNELKLDVYRLDMQSMLPLARLSTLYVNKTTTVGNVKKQIRAELKRKNILDLQDGKWLFVDYNEEILGDVWSNDENRLHSTDGICLCPSDSPICVKKWNRKDMQLENPEPISVTGDNINIKLKETISSMSKIPLECLELCPMVVGKQSALDKIETFKWISDINNDEIDCKTYILYRDSRETPKILTEEEKNNMRRNAISRQDRYNLPPTPMTSSPRREKALKIHVDPS
ncbi:ubiquitin carboxyl-terminal hydrolase 47 [Nasonia vitripennis]|uniref:Ubiquitin carboxyl-terminal hydrolase 47 n=1 Tax=Nasonia vitripennis TaxID=7425 RepID=A0A7M7QBM2_NASVI|nr:ubiquitin carboxyl-terminal hydrolase 47 [Nasonia vitripennis]XP_008211153.1 ubiquitin carboxyl-terminal hydrolase 47 [Nasonia vitripennis]XP_008211168.1 ubiquitin carboxyl-terminal hydrolase 47 [Nasonia vitripennis]XP_031784819.1 ubiquitin carboxyl-terminal hydrolase 47 [Nasonia vitripennis]XP_031784833.1 ubiquitin carboxyl-terminal hydrolase 47 [Nasonia vitripennis]XP_032455901.1 ubiquitin carboxyl-terminal hydrolase 47 [Nasonia vitripennis]XP_032455902.1 ubiquitin carboxyl-terminal hydr